MTYKLQLSANAHTLECRIQNYIHNLIIFDFIFMVNGAVLTHTSSAHVRELPRRRQHTA